MFRELLVCGVAACGVMLPALGRDNAPQDPRPLTSSEDRTFFRVTCARPLPKDKDENCALLRSYPREGQAKIPVRLEFEAIAYGSFTRLDADQAYVTYSGDFEPHLAGYGGGILFERSNGSWRLVHWFSGAQMDRCVALPLERQQRMLCLAVWNGQGETDSSLWIMQVPTSPSGEVRQAPVLKAQDDTEAGDGDDMGNYQCSLARRHSEGILLSVDRPRRSGNSEILAEADIVYAKARDADAACQRKSFANVRQTKGIVRFKLEGSHIVVLAPEKFAKTDY